MTTPAPDTTPEPQKWTYIHATNQICENGKPLCYLNHLAHEKLLAALNRDGDADTRRLDFIIGNPALLLKFKLQSFNAGKIDKGHTYVRSLIDDSLSEQAVLLKAAQSTEVASNAAAHGPIPAPAADFRELERGTDTTQEGDEMSASHLPWVRAVVGITNWPPSYRFRRRREPVKPAEAEGQTPRSIDREVAREAELLILDMEGKEVRFQNERERAIAWNVVRCRLHRERTDLARVEQALEGKRKILEITVSKLADAQRELGMVLDVRDQLAVARADLERVTRERDAAIIQRTRQEQIDRDKIIGLESQIAQLRAEKDALTARLEAVVNTLTNFCYSHDEIEAACGGESALQVREKVMARRADIEETARQAGLEGKE